MSNIIKFNFGTDRIALKNFNWNTYKKFHLSNLNVGTQKTTLKKQKIVFLLFFIYLCIIYFALISCSYKLIGLINKYSYCVTIDVG